MQDNQFLMDYVDSQLICFWRLIETFPIVIFLLLSVLKILSRHSLLASSIGTREEEDRSLRTGFLLLATTTGAILAFSLIEIGLFFLYNFKVKNMRGDDVNIKQNIKKIVTQWIIMKIKLDNYNLYTWHKD